MPKERVGIMGGSFNPIHQRHLDIAAAALEEARLSRVLFLPTGNPPHKRADLANPEHRFEMTRLMVLGKQSFTASRLEVDREGVIYTVDTLSLLQKQFPGAELFYLIGEDTLLDLLSWRQPDQVFSMCRFLVCRRSSKDAEAHPQVKEMEARGAKFTFLSLPPVDISATAIREKLAKGQAPVELAPQVLEYIRIMGLYGGDPSPPNAAVMYPTLRQALSDKRLNHSLLVAATARQLATVHHLDADAAALSGLLHDCAKCLPLHVLQQIAREHRLLLDKETLQSENLLHGPVGAVLAEDVYGVHNPNVLSAIACHTTGKVGMLPLDMALFLADKIEPSRRPYPALDEVRLLANTSLIEAMRYSLGSTLAYVQAQKVAPHPLTRRVSDWLGRLQTQQNQRSEVHE